MPCAGCCGKKADRYQDLLTCASCKQMFHKECVGISLSEFRNFNDTVNKYNCSTCLSMEKNSTSAGITETAPDATIGTTSAYNDINELLGCVSDMSDQNTTGSNIIGVAPANMDDAIDLSLSSQNGVEGTLALVLAELARIRLSHDALHSKIEALRDDNSSLKADNGMLKSKLSDVQSKLDSLINGSSDKITISPKRKKTAKNINGNLNVAPLLVVESEIGESTTIGTPLLSTDDDYPPLATMRSKDATASWSQVVRKRSNLNINTINSANKAHVSQKKTPVVVGASTNSDLEVVDKKQWFHLGSFRSTMSPESIISYIVKHFELPEEELSCFRLVKKDIDISTLKSINFKLGVASRFAERILDASLWPANVRIRHFDFLDKPKIL